MSEERYDAIRELCRLLRESGIEPWFHLPECSIWMVPNRCDQKCSLLTWQKHVSDCAALAAARKVTP